MPEDARVLYLDLDTLIVGGLDEIASYDGEHARLGPFFANVKPEFSGPQSGVMAWRGGFGEHIWQTYVNVGFPDLPGGDQKFLNQVQPACDLWQEMFPGAVVSFKGTGGAEPKGETKIVCFHGKPRPHEVMIGWAPGAWRKKNAYQTAFACECQ